jgi:phospholipid transport system substrate-binding protein
VFDISVDDVSLVSNYSSSFARQIRKHGIDGLIRTLHDRNQDYDI